MAQNYFKRNYKDALENIIPPVYFNTKVETSGMADPNVDSVINSHINFCINQSSLLNVSAVGAFSSINTVDGMSRWFIKENYRKNNISPIEFETQILHKLGLCTGTLVGLPCSYFSPDSTQSESNLSGIPYDNMVSFFKDSVLPKIILNSSALADTTTSAFSNTASGTHEYLINRLGWMYFLNTSAAEVSPSGYVASAITDMYTSATNFSINDGIKGLSNYIWRNWSTLSSVTPPILPTVYYSGTGEYVSGTQGLDNLNTITDIIYSDLIADKDDPYVLDAFTNYTENGDYLDNRERTGPFSKFIEGVSYSLFDTNNEAQKLQYLYDLDNCPDNLLKYLAELIGWRLKGSNTSGWRRQLRYAVKLYKQKGTKEGLYNAMTTVLPGTALESSSISEFYESYIPFLVYYLLKTDTNIFDSFNVWTPVEAALYTSGEYNYDDMDHNIRVLIDHIFLEAVEKFNELFYVRNFKFDIKNPEFVFEYRGRAFPIPPWEEIKFYRSCDVTAELLTFLKDKLLCFGVSEKNAALFYDYISDNIISRATTAEYYSNAFLFFTSSLNTPPNESSILDRREVEKYDYLPLWSGKSSTFNVSVSSGSFDTPFFNSSIFSRHDFFQSLSIVDEFSPAKAIARTHVDLLDTEYMQSSEYTCPSVRYWLQDLSISGFTGGGMTSGVNFSGINGMFGGDYPTPANSGRARNDHTNLPVFTRDMVDFPIDFVQMEGSSLSAAPLSNVDRTNMRRRNFSKNLEKGGWYSRTGFNMPSYYNSSDTGSYTDFYPLGYVFDQYQYNPVINYKNLYEVSSWPYGDPVWADCYGPNSVLSFSSIPVSSTFDIRGNTALSQDSCNPYARRDRPPEFFEYLHKLLDKKYTMEATNLYNINKNLLDVSTFRNPINSITNTLWDNTPDSMQPHYDEILGKRMFGINSPDGMHKMYKDYISYFTGTGIGDGLLETYKDGGPNILSNIYGPLLYNGNFTVDGSAIETSSQLLTTILYEEYPFTVSSLSGLDNATITESDDMPVEVSEFRNPYVLSGVELVDASSGSSEFSVYRLDPLNASPTRDNFTIDNTLIVLDVKSKFPRIRFNLKDYGEETNFILPQRKYNLSLKATVGRVDSGLLGGDSFGVWIHTDVESDSVGNKVFWNLMPDGEWVMFDASILQDKGAINYVKYVLSHSLDYTELYNPGMEQCFARKASKEVIGSLEEDDFRVGQVPFSTKNNKIKLPLNYYQVHNELHRADQNYIVEVFPYTNSDPSIFAIIDSVSISDLRQYDRSFVKHPISYHNYSLAKNKMANDIDFYDSNGLIIASGTQLSASPVGEMITQGGSKVTAHVSDAIGPFVSIGKLYSSVNLTIQAQYSKDANLNSFYMAPTSYDGIFSIGPSGLYYKDSSLSPSSIIATGKTEGSNIQTDEVLLVPLDAHGVLIILREFKRLSQELGSRNKSISSSQYGAEGGSRLNYRDAPMWGQTGGYDTFESNARQYTKIHLEN